MKAWLSLLTKEQLPAKEETASQPVTTFVVGSLILNTILFADDQVPLSQTADNLQIGIQQFDHISTCNLEIFP